MSEYNLIRATDDQIAEWHAHLEDDGTTPDAIVLADALESVLCELNAERLRWFDAMTRMECETDCGNCNVCRLQATIHVRAGQLRKQRETLNVAQEWARWFAAIAAKQRRDNARLDDYQDAMRDVRRILTDFGITNPPPRLAALLKEGADE